jgi:hypothetical protein
MFYAGYFRVAQYMKFLRLKTFERFKLLLARLFALTPARSYAFAVLARLKADGAGLRGVDLERARICIRQGKILEALEMLKEEVRLYPENWDAKKLLDKIRNSVPPAYSAVSEELAKVLPSILPYTMLSIERLEALFLGAKNVCIEDLEGNFVECGVAAGGSSALLAWVIKKYSSQPRPHLHGRVVLESSDGGQWCVFRPSALGQWLHVITANARWLVRLDVLAVHRQGANCRHQRWRRLLLLPRFQ